MNRFVSLLLVALSLAAVGLAQPAQAQWVRGLPYFLNSNSQSSTPGTTVTASINNNSTGHINITAAPSSTVGSTSGSYGGSVGVYYVWSGSTPTSAMTLTTTLGVESTGAAGGAGGYGTSGSSSADGQQAYGDFSHYPTGWDQPQPAPGTAAGIQSHFAAGVTPASQNLTVSLGGSVSAYYYNNSGPSIVTADVTFSPPVTTYP